MKTLFRWLGRLVVSAIAVIAAIALFAPREAVNLDVSFDEALLSGGVSAYFEGVEAAYDDITPNAQKRVIWAGAPEQKTPVSVVYIHGFSATSEEIRPVPDRLAAALGANLVFTRLRGHGRSGAAMAEASAADWMRDTLEALAAGRAVGERVIVVSTSTGGTLMAAAALRGDAMRNVAGSIFVSPNFAINTPASAMLTWPGVRWWGPIVAGEERSFEAHNAAHETYWTNSYPTVALIPMAALVKAVDALDMGQAQVPALFMFSDQDKVVSAAKTRAVADAWGSPSAVLPLSMGAGDDAYSHVIAGDILSPSQTEGAAQAMITWAQQVLAD